jgi:hypothetical protein
MSSDVESRIGHLIAESNGEFERLEKGYRENKVLDLAAAFELLTGEYDSEPEHGSESLFTLAEELDLAAGSFSVINQQGGSRTIHAGLSFKAAQKIVCDSLELAIVGEWCMSPELW